MQLNFVTVDVFTDQQFGGNPLAVVLNGHGLTTEQMQSIAEFNLAETTFVLPPKVPHQRRFTLHNVLEWWIGRTILLDKFDSGFRGLDKIMHWVLDGTPLMLIAVALTWFAISMLVFISVFRLIDR